MADSTDAVAVDDGAPPQEYQVDRTAVAAALAEIDRRQAHHPTCALCGQRAVKLTKYGLCSKSSDSHKAWKREAEAEAAADAKAGRR